MSYCTSLVRNSRRESIFSLNRKMAGLAFLFRLSGLADITKSFLVKKALRGYRRGRQVPDSRCPVSFAMLGILLPKVCLTSFEAILFRTAFILALFGVLWVGELVSPSTRVGGGLGVLDVLVHL